MTLRIHMSIHNDDLHKTTAKRNLAGGVAGLDGSGHITDTLYDGIEKYYIISNNLLHNHDAFVSKNSEIWVKVKTITINNLNRSPETIRTYFEFKSTSPWTENARARIYKNGGAHGTEHATTSTSFIPKTEDLIFSQGDTLELWVRQDWGGYTTDVKNFRIYGNETNLPIYQAIIDSDVGLTNPFSGTNS